MNYQHPMNVAPNAHFTSAPLDSDKTYNAPSPVVFGFQPQRNQFMPSVWERNDYQQQPQMVQVVLPFPPQMCYTPPPVYPISAMPDQTVHTQLPAIRDQTVSVPTMREPSVSLPSMIEQTLPMAATPTPQSPNVPMFVFSPPTYNTHPIQHPSFMGYVQTDNSQAQFFPSSTSVSPPPQRMEEPRRNNTRTPPGFDNSSARKKTLKDRRPLQTRSENETERPRRRNNKRKNKKQAEQVAPGEYRPSYRSKQDMIDKVFLALSQKYTALGLLENKGLRGDDTIRVHVKNFKALTRIEEALIEVESHPKVKVSKVSLPFSFRNEFQKKGFLVYLKLEDVTMVPHAQTVFRQYDEFKKCGVMRETGQYVESLPLAQANLPSATVTEKPASPEWDPTMDEMEEDKGTPDYASSTESASTADLAESDSDEQLCQTVISESAFGPLTALASTTRQQTMPRKNEKNNFSVRALMRAARRISTDEEASTGECHAPVYANHEKLTLGTAL